MQCSQRENLLLFSINKVRESFAGELENIYFLFLDRLTLSSESEPGQVRFAGQWEGFAVDELPLPFTKLQQLDTESLLSIETRTWEWEMTHTHKHKANALFHRMTDHFIISWVTDKSPIYKMQENSRNYFCASVKLLLLTNEIQNR